MSALSKKQQQFFALVHQYQNGDLNDSEVSPDVVKAAKSVSKKDAKDFASTKHDTLPDSVDEEINLERFIKIIRKEVIQNLKDGNYNRDIISSFIESGNKLNEI